MTLFYTIKLTPPTRSSKDSQPSTQVKPLSSAPMVVPAHIYSRN